MSAVQGAQRFQEIARKWHDLAERRLAYYSELYRSGRWAHYYESREQFAMRMLDVIRAARAWAKLAGHEPAPLEETGVLPNDLRNAA